MKQEQKELLLKDLCARLPYGVKVKISCIESPLTVLSINTNGVAWVKGDKGYPFDIDWEYCKPYLFPLSSMSDEQKGEYNNLKHLVPTYHYEYGDIVEEDELWDSPLSYQYLIENHFDCNDLIPLGLAIDCTNLNIY